VKREGVKREKSRESVKRESVKREGVKNVVAGLKACEKNIKPKYANVAAGFTPANFRNHKGCGYKNNAYCIPIEQRSRRAAEQ